MREHLRTLVLPGWQSSGADHWQSRWEALHGFERVQQDDWWWPKRGDWMARLEDVLLADERPARLVAHSLGCHLVAAWAAHSQNKSRVRAALLVAPPDLQRADMPPNVSTWAPPIRARLPFAATLVAADNDPYCDLACAQGLARDWGAGFVNLGPRGHVNAESGLGDWPEGLALLQALDR
jgi:uncharacterized protein